MSLRLVRGASNLPSENLLVLATVRINAQPRILQAFRLLAAVRPIAHFAPAGEPAVLKDINLNFNRLFVSYHYAALSLLALLILDTLKRHTIR